MPGLAFVSPAGALSFETADGFPIVLERLPP
jgi:hypothetical protein